MINKVLKIGVAQGDTNGIGWEIILKVFSDSRMCEICTPIIYGSAAAAEFYKETMGEVDNISFNVVASASEARKGRINLVECGSVVKTMITPGKASALAGTAAVEALAKATEELKAGAIDAMVTAPFNKESVQSEKFAFTGHTEYLASQFEGENMMMMCSELLKVGLVTKHLPITKVPAAINKESIVKDLTGLRKTLIQDFSIVEPRIAVLSLNPHAGDGGLLGAEEQEVIVPAIQEAYANGIFAFGPFPADGFFAAGLFKKYDAILAMYHDQGLTPFKTLSPDGVNFTAGLSAIRTSPDHGVAYDRAGQNSADPASMRNAIYMAIDIARSRDEYKTNSANPLQHIETERERDRGHRPPRERREGR
ncbi:MAG: 4-hydroxythreonine-4-phosphate dehydrogenase PdxA [Rikenellaceae bacterium]